MKIAKLLAPPLLLFLSTSVASAAKAKGPQPSAGTQAHLGTSFRFDGSSLHGKYQTSPEATVSVENDKFLEDLLGARKNFDDRIKRDTERN